MAKKKTVEPAMIEGIAGNLLATVAPLRKVLRRLETVQASSGLPTGLIHVLFMLSDMGSMTISEISERLSIAKPNITPMVDRLIEGGYVERVRSKDDRRVVNIVIHDAGRKKLKAIKADMDEQVREWADSIPAADFAELSDSLSSLARILPLLPVGRAHDDT